MSGSRCSRARLVLPMKTSHRRAHLELPPMVTHLGSHRQLHLAWLSSHRQPRGKIAQKCKLVGIAHAENVGMLLPNALQANAGKLTTKQTAQVSIYGDQIGIDARQRRPSKTGKQFPSCLSPKSKCSQQHRRYVNWRAIAPLKLMQRTAAKRWFNISTSPLDNIYCNVHTALVFKFSIVLKF